MTFFRRGKTKSIPLLIILVIGLAVRLMYLFVIVHPDAPLSNIDSIEHDQIARNLLAGKGYSLYGHPTANRAPLLTYFLVLVYRIFGYRLAVARLGMIAISLLVLVIIYFLALRFENERVATLSALVAALWPPFLFFSARIFTEMPFILFSLLSLYFLEKGMRIQKNLWFILSGFVAGLATLTRPVGAFLMLFIIIYALFKKRNGTYRWKSILTMLLAFAISLSPWLVRNWSTFHTFVPVTTQGSLVFYVSNNHYVAHHPELWGMYALYQHLPGTRMLIVQDEIQRSQNARRLAIAHLRKYYPDIPRLIWNKFRRFWHWRNTLGSRRPWVYEVPYLFLLPGSILGALVMLRQRRYSADMLWILLLANLVPALIFWAGTRIRVPADPALIIFAANGVEWVYSKIRGNEDN